MVRLLSSKAILLLICLFFLFTRLYKISEIPLSVYWDEASIGYNAYSILKTGRDEWGNFMPLHFRAFGEFKLPVYIYSVVPSVMIFGLNAFAVRLPAVLFSLGVVIFVYFLTRKLYRNESLGLLAAFFTSVSPWFFVFSRTGYEATAGLMFYLLAIYFFLKNRDSSWFIFFSIISFILSIYSYNSYRLVVPLTVLVLIISEFAQLKKIIKTAGLPVILSVIILALSIIPIYRLYLYDNGISRWQAVNAATESLIGNYLSHFSLEFLVISGDKNLRSQQAGFGQVYIPTLLFLLVGSIYLIIIKPKYSFLPIMLLLLGPLPAAMTKESPHALRALSAVPFISIISAIGVFYLSKFSEKQSLIYLSVIVIFSVLFIRYFVSFLNVYPVQSATAWQYEYKKIFFDNINKINSKKQVRISDKYGQPYIFALFYLQIPPDKFRQTVVRNSVDKWGFSTVASFDKFKFGKDE